MRATRLLFLLLVAGCKGNTVVLDDTGSGVPDDGCPVVGVDPISLSWSGTTGPQSLSITNDCPGETPLRVQVAINGAAAFTPGATSLELAPGDVGTLEITFEASDAALYEADLVLATNDPVSPTITIPLTGSLDTDFDDDGHDAVASGGDDCDDTDPGVNPDAEEIWYDGVDQDCDGANDNDQDGDGYEATVAGGDDCDDEDGAINPGATEVWYDGVDQDCDGANDLDQDGDGHDAQAYGGDDCDDLDPTVNGGNAEVQDALDNDCDGLADEDWVLPNDIIVTEVMVDSSTVEDAHGEYFEVANLSANPINLTGWVVSTPDGGSFAVSGNVTVASGGLAVFAPDGDSATNGGHATDYVYSRGDLPLDNSTGGLTLTMGGTTIFSMAYDSGWGVSAGAALNLDSSFINATAATDPAYWCDATSDISGGDLGTPGTTNDLCTSVDHDGDGVSIDGGDCDDADPNVNPAATEVWDGLDNDCDGSTDVMDVADVAAGYVTGATSGQGADYLGFLYSLSAADITGDGATDLLVGGNDASNNDAGRVYALPVASYTTFAGAATSYDTATFEGAENEGRFSGTYTGYNYFGQVGPAMGDVNADGVADLTIGGNDEEAGSYYYPYDSNVAFAVFYGGSGIADAYANEGDILYYGASTPVSSYAPEWVQMITSDTDLDGDGSADIVYSDPYDSSDAFGTVYAFSGAGLVSGGDLGDDNDVLLDGDDSDDNLGAWVGSMDYNGDGYADIAAGAPGDDDARTDAGAFIFYNGSATLSEDANINDVYSLKITGPSREGYMGYRGGVVMGDVDNDGAADLVVGNPLDEMVYVFLGAASLTGSVSASNADLSIENAGSGPEYFGHALAIGDYSGDGAPDLVIGAPDAIYTDRGDADTAGRVYFYNGSQLVSGAALTEADASGALVGDGAYEAFGGALLTVDLNGDSRDDLMVSSHLWSSGSTTAGKVWFIDWN